MKSAMIRGGPARFALILWWTSLAWLWGAFWFHDLRFARAADVLLLLPVCGAVAAGVGGRFRHGVAGALFVLWLYFWDRASGVGCVGVSPAYEEMLGGTLIAFLLLGAFWLFQCFQPGGVELRR
jgi:hypothetical protein